MTQPTAPCVFCQIIEGSAESSEVYRDKSCIAFMDLGQINPGHVLICPIRHVASFVDLEPRELTAILSAAQKIARAQLRKLPDCLGVNLLLSDGEAAGQEVPHTHFHVLPRGDSDGFGWLRFGNGTTRQELDQIAAELRDE